MPLSLRFFQKKFETGLQAKINLQLKQRFETYSFVLWMNRAHQSHPTSDEIKHLCEPGSESTLWEAQKVKSCPRGPTVPRFPQGTPAPPTWLAQPLICLHLHTGWGGRAPLVQQCTTRLSHTHSVAAPAARYPSSLRERRLLLTLGVIAGVCCLTFHQYQCVGAI